MKLALFGQDCVPKRLAEKDYPRDRRRRHPDQAGEGHGVRRREDADKHSGARGVTDKQ